MASGAAKRYAQAIFGLAKDAGTFDRWLDDLAGLAEVVGEPAVADYFANPKVTEGAKLAVVDRILAEAQPEARNLARMLVQRGRIGIVGDVAQLYGQMVLAERRIAVAEVTTAEPLGPREQAMVQAQLAKLAGRRVQARYHVDPEIIGGVVARIGDQLIDGSVSNQLRRLRARLAAA